MATENFIIRVEERGSRRVKRNIAEIGTAAKSVQRTLALLRSALVVVASARVIGNFTQLLDIFTRTSNLLRQITRDTEQLNQVQTQLFTISQKTRASFESTVIFFNRLTRATANLNLNFGELFDLTTTVNQTLALSSATAQETSNALIQFSQGLAAGALQGEELLSVSEQLPALAEIIGKEFGVSGAELRSLNEQNPGILKTARVIKALRDAAERMGKSFGEANVTIEQGFTRVRNALIAFSGSLNSATGLSQTLADALTKIAENINIVIAGLVTFAGVVVFNVVISQVVALTARIAALSTMIVRGLGVAAVGAVRALVNALSILRAAMTGIAAIAAATGAPFLLIGGIVAGVLVGAFLLFKDTIDNVLESLGGFTGIFEVIATNALAAVDTIVANWRQIDNVFADLGMQAANAFLDGIQYLLDQTESAFNAITGFVGLPAAEFGRIGNLTNNFAGAAANFATEFNGFKQEIQDAGGGTKVLQERFERLLQTIQNFSGTGLSAEVLDQLRQELPTVARGGDGLAGQDDDGAARKLEELKSALDSLRASVSPAYDAMLQMTEAQNILDDAVKKNLITEGVRSEVLRRLTRDIVGVGNEVTNYAEKVELLNKALKEGAISQREFSETSRNMRIEFLEDQKSIGAGVERTLLKWGKEAEDRASVVETAMTGAFRNAEDVIVKFAQTGKFAVKDMALSISQDLARLAIRNGFQGMLGSLSGIAGGALGAAAGGGASGGAAASGGEAYANSLAGSGGGGGFFSFLSGFANGGTFDVNKRNSVATASGVDNRVVAFRANDSEEVEVRKKGGKAKQSGDTINMNFNIKTQDADSFRRSRQQVMAEMSSALTRARDRNG